MNSQEASEFLKKAMNEVQEMSTTTQILVGGTAGLATGYIFSKLGKLAAISVGTAVILLQVAHHTGYIEVKLGKKSKIDDLKQKALKAAEDVGLTTNKNSQLENFGRQLKSFLQKNATFGISFGGGALIGVAI